MVLPSNEDTFSPKEKGKVSPDFWRIDEAAAEPRERSKSIGSGFRTRHVTVPESLLLSSTRAAFTG